MIWPCHSSKILESENVIIVQDLETKYTALDSLETMAASSKVENTHKLQSTNSMSQVTL